MPILFHNRELFGEFDAVTRYLTINNATSISWLFCIIDPAANIVVGLVESKDNALPKVVNALK